DLVDPATRDAVRLRQAEQMLAGAPTAVHGLGVEQCAHLVERKARVDVGPPPDGDRSRVGTIEPEDAPHRGRLPGAVRPEDPRDRTRLHVEAQAVEGDGRAVVLGEPTRLDDGAAHWIHPFEVAGRVTWTSLTMPSPSRLDPLLGEPNRRT